MSGYIFWSLYFDREMSSELDAIDTYAIKKVKEKRIESGLSQAQLANLLDVSTGFIGMVESGNYQHKYSLAQLNEIAKILKCELYDFIPQHPL